MTTAQSKKRLALAVLDFLQTSQRDGTVEAEDAEQLEIAQNCIAEAFKVDPTDEAATKDALGGSNLLSIYSVYEKLKGKNTASTEGESSAKEARPATPSTPAAGSKDAAEKLKGQGNEAMKKKDYTAAIDFYSKALDLIPLNPIYLSNRAAAYSGQGKHEEAKNDAEMAVAADPKYSKAWSRLGLAKYVLGDSKGAMEAYKAGMDAEGGGSEVMRKGYETAKKKYEEEGGDVAAPETSRGGPGAGAGGMPDLSGLASMLGGGGGAGGGGGMPDFGAMMNNPMMRQMAQNIMSNPDALNNLLSNPRIAEMAERFGGGGGAGRGGGGGGAGGGGMPNLQEMMNDPSIAEMARNFMGGMGGAGGPGGAGGAGRGAQ